MFRKLLVALAAFLVIVPGTAGAHERMAADANDVAGPLDIQRYKTRHNATKVIFEITTYHAWSKQDVTGDAGTIFVIIKLPDTDSYLIVVKTDTFGQLRATLQECTPDCSAVKAYDVDKPNGRTALFRIPRSKLSGVGPVMKSVAETGSGHTCEPFCNLDFAPNSGYAKHDIGPAG